MQVRDHLCSLRVGAMVGGGSSPDLIMLDTVETDMSKYLANVHKRINPGHRVSWIVGLSEDRTEKLWLSACKSCSANSLGSMVIKSHLM